MFSDSIHASLVLNNKRIFLLEICCSLAIHRVKIKSAIDSFSNVNCSINMITMEMEQKSSNADISCM